MCYACDDQEITVPCKTGECAGDCAIFECKDCGENTLHTDEYYMVTNELWKEAARPGEDGSGMLCIGCLEARLGRELTARDFPPLPINGAAMFGQSGRLKARLRTSH